MNFFKIPQVVKQVDISVASTNLSDSNSNTPERLFKSKADIEMIDEEVKESQYKKVAITLNQEKLEKYSETNNYS
jgi:hypothetical protein